MTNVVICGPNLRDQKKGQFHVHVEGCADLKRMLKREPAYKEGWLLEDPDSKQEIVEHIYEDHMREAIMENGHIDWREFDDVYLFPCVTDIPDDAPMDAVEDDEVDSEEEDDVEEEDEEDGDVPDTGEDSTDPFEAVVRLAQKHGASDGVAIAEEALTIETITGYLDENLDDELYEEASSFDLDRVAKAYVTTLMTGFTARCQIALNQFLEDENQE